MSKVLYLLIGITSSLVSLSVQQFDCDDYYRDGTYCTNDLTGYHVCTRNRARWRWDHKIVACPSNTRCSCHHRRRCRLKPSKICKPFTVPKPVVDPAIFSFTESDTTEYIDDFYEDVVTLSSGEIRQDKSKKKYMKIYKKNNVSRCFNLILPSKRGGYYNSFHGNFETKSCKIWRLYTSRIRKYLASDLHKYTLMKSYADKKGTTHQEWFFRKGDYEGQYFDRFWYVSLDSSGKNVKPTKYVEKFLASEDNTHTRTTVMKWTIKTPVAGTSTDQWFKIPDFCKYTE